MNKETKIEVGKGIGVKTPALLYEMIRSFVVLSDTLNLSHAVLRLESTRQTVRRHITNLEEIMGETLFVVDDRRYQLTEAGRGALPEAVDLLARGEVWANGKIRDVNGLLRLSHEEPNGWSFYQQQQPLTQIWNLESAVLRDVFRGWVDSNGELESPEFQKHRPYILVYRDSPNGWICVELGEESFYTKWWGWSNARSSIGRPLGQFPGGPEFAEMLNVPFREVQATGAVRLDEVVTQIPREDNGLPIPLAYKRLLLASRFPDGSFALIAVVDRSRSVTISGLDQSTLDVMPADAIVAF
jgi:hypothetical protein